MPTAVLGTAHLFGASPEPTSAAVLTAAWDAGFRAFDTAPLYGHGRSEIELGVRLREWPGPAQLTTKAGLEAVEPPARGVRIAKAAARRLPAPVRRRLRPGGADGPRGDLDPDLLRRSLDRSLARLGHVDRFLLHEARAEDVTDEVLALLVRCLDHGDVGRVGVAGMNTEAAAVVRRAPELFTVAHVDIGPFAPDPGLPDTVTTVVGHGVLGPGGDALQRLRPLLDVPGEASDRWRTTTAGTRWAGPDGLAAALVARAASRPVSDVIVATSRVERLAGLRDLVSRATRMPEDVTHALEQLVSSAR